MGIRHTGFNSAKLLAQNYNSLLELSKASPEELCNIEGIGEITAQEINKFFAEPSNLALIEKLQKAEIQTEYKITESQIFGKFMGKSFVITGTFEISRENIQETIEKAGGKVVSAISAKTNYLVCGEKAGSKLEKAQKLNIQILSFDDLEQLII